jgi:hypothetical protein
VPLAVRAPFGGDAPPTAGGRDPPPEEGQGPEQDLGDVGRRAPHQVGGQGLTAGCAVAAEQGRQGGVHGPKAAG